MNEIKIRNKIRYIMEENIFNNISEDMNILDILYLMCEKFNSNKCELSYERKYNKVVLHPLRVYTNVQIIINYLECKGKLFTVNEKEDIMIASLFHDVGKLYKDSGKHPLLGAVMKGIRLMTKDTIRINID